MKFGKLYRFKSKMDMMVKLIDIYIVLTPDASKLIQREKEALAFYMLYGYNKDSLKDIESGLSAEINNGYVRTINNNLRKKGYMRMDDRNFKINHLSEEMEKIREAYVAAGEKTFTIGFLKL